VNPVWQSQRVFVLKHVGCVLGGSPHHRLLLFVQLYGVLVMMFRFLFVFEPFGFSDDFLPNDLLYPSLLDLFIPLFAFVLLLLLLTPGFIMNVLFLLALFLLTLLYLILQSLYFTGDIALHELEVHFRTEYFGGEDVNLRGFFPEFGCRS